MLASLVLIIAAPLGHVGAQTKRDFSGEWVIVGNVVEVRQVNGRPISFGSSLSDRCVAKQDAKLLTFADPTGQVLLKVALDGSETRRVMPARDGQTRRELVSTAKWDATELIVSTRIAPAPGLGLAPSTQMLSLNPQGQLVLKYQQAPTWPVVTFLYKKPNS